MGRAMAVLDRVLEAACAAVLAATVAIAFAAVVFRYVIGAALSWSFEASLALLTWLTFVGAFLAMRKGAHLKVEVFVARLPLAGQAIVFALNQAIVLGVCGVMVVYGLRQAIRFFGQTTPVMEIAAGWLYLAVPVGGALMALQALGELVAGLARARRGEPPFPPATPPDAAGT